MRILGKILNVSILSLINKISEKIKQMRYASHSHQKVFDWNWGSTNFNRIALVNFLVSSTKGWNAEYLEIGCAGNDLFDSVAAKNKVGVDPVGGGTKRTTSDEFFVKNEKQFDVIFVDGLHEYE